jgi:hypothetical protein
MQRHRLSAVVRDSAPLLLMQRDRLSAVVRGFSPAIFLYCGASSRLI